MTANTVVQKFLHTISGMDCGPSNICMEPEDMLIPLKHLTKVLGLLLNPFITELDFTIFDRLPFTPNYIIFLMEYALDNCPKISKIKLMDTLIYTFYKERNLLPVERFKQSWNNLKSISCHEDYICIDETLKLIQENIPNIESVIYIYV